MSLTNEDRPSKIKEYFQYAHQPTRGDSLTLPDFGIEVTNWWKRIQPEWRQTEQDPPRTPDRWSYILSGGSKGAFLLILCLAWWRRAYEQYLESQKETRRVEAKATGAVARLDDLPDHDAEWLEIVNDLVFVMGRAQIGEVPTKGMPSPSHRVKRKRGAESPTPRRSLRGPKSKVIVSHSIFQPSTPPQLPEIIHGVSFRFDSCGLFLAYTFLVWTLLSIFLPTSAHRVCFPPFWCSPVDSIIVCCPILDSHFLMIVPSP